MGNFKNAPSWPNLGARASRVRQGGDSASLLACIVRVLTADFPFISL